MIVFDLVCKDGGHQFEGWFGSSSDYEDQKQGNMIDCPSCGSTSVEKALMAPNLGMKDNQRSVPSTPTNASEVEQAAPSENVPASSPPAESVLSNALPSPSEYKELVSKLAKVQAKMLEKSEWVGDSFAEEARAIHYGETEEKLIHGVASTDDVEELSEEGIDIAPLPLPVTPPKIHN